MGEGVSVGDRVRAARERANLNVSALARLVGVSHTAINHIEAGQRNASPDLVFRIAEVTRSSVAELMGAERGVQYVITHPEKGLLSTKPYEEWPDFLKGPAPTNWPGTLRSFIASVGADLMQLIPEEVPLLAKTAHIGGVPLTEAQWISHLSILRMLIGADGRPVVHEMVDADDKPEG